MILAALVYLATFNILFNPVTGASSYTCLAYERHQAQSHPDLAILNGGLVASAPVYTVTSWASVTCTVVGAFPGSRGDVYFAQVPTSAVDPNLPGLQVIACVKSIATNGTASACIDAANFTPSDPANPLIGGPTSTAVANASDQ